MKSPTKIIVIMYYYARNIRTKSSLKGNESAKSSHIWSYRLLRYQIKFNCFSTIKQISVYMLNSSTTRVRWPTTCPSASWHLMAIVVSFLSLSVGSSHLAQNVTDGVPCLLKPADSVTTPFEFTILPYIYRISDVCIQHAFKCNILP